MNACFFDQPCLDVYVDACVLGESHNLAISKSPINDASIDFFGGICGEDVDLYLPLVVGLNDSKSKFEEEEENLIS